MQHDDNLTTSVPAAGAGAPTAALAAGAALAMHGRGYAVAVRLHLADLGPEVADDLTGGLEADLAEALEDRLPVGPRTGDVVLDLTATFGPAAAYAAELRSAAGLPPAGPPRRGGLRGAVAAKARRSRARWAARLEPVTSHPWWAAARDLAHVLRPAWWLARGWIVGLVVVAVPAAYSSGASLSLVPTSPSALLVVSGCALVSVQWARGRWLPRRAARPLLRTASVGALLVLPLVLTETADVARADEATAYATEVGYDGAHAVSYGGFGEDGVWVDGEKASNLFVFDANGDPLRDVQVFDDRGRPVRAVGPDEVQSTWEVPQVDGYWYLRPTPTDDGHDRWNVYPQQALPENAMVWDDDGELVPAVGVQPEDVPWPFLKAPTTITRPGVPDAPPADDAAPPAGDPAVDDPGAGATPSPTPTSSPGASGGGATQRPTGVRGAVVDASPAG